MTTNDVPSIYDRPYPLRQYDGLTGASAARHRPVAQRRVAADQGLTLVHFSAQLEPCLTQENTLHILHTPTTPLTRATQPLGAPPILYKALKLS